MSGVQHTLNGEEAPDRKRPSTLIYCPECGDSILRSERFSHEHDIPDVETMHTAERRMRVEELEEKLPVYALADTTKYTVTFHYEYRETISVEAEDSSEAKSIAKDRRTYDGNYVETLHTNTRGGESSPPSIEYLEARGFLAEGHDVTQEDIETYIELTEGDNAE